MSVNQKNDLEKDMKGIDLFNLFWGRVPIQLRIGEKNVSTTKSEPQEKLSNDEPKVEDRKTMNRRRMYIQRTNRESRKKIQADLAEISKSIRETQRAIKEMYQFEPCRQLCELAVDIRQNVYKNVEEVQEELEYIIEAFGIRQFEAIAGDSFDAKYHDQVYSNVSDARGREIAFVYSPGYIVDNEVILKAQVCVK